MHALRGLQYSVSLSICLSFCLLHLAWLTWPMMLLNLDIHVHVHAYVLVLVAEVYGHTYLDLHMYMCTSTLHLSFVWVHVRSHDVSAQVFPDFNTFHPRTIAQRGRSGTKVMWGLQDCIHVQCKCNMLTSLLAWLSSCQDWDCRL